MDRPAPWVRRAGRYSSRREKPWLIGQREEVALKRELRSWDSYWREVRRLDPDARSPSDIYTDWVVERAAGRRWLDAGCGRRSVPVWRSTDLEQLLTSGTRLFGCDLDLAALHDREGSSHVCGATLDRLPFRDACFDLVTANMVFEHLDHPQHAVAELARVTSPGGEVVVHTVNARHYLSWAARITPLRFHQFVVSRLEGRAAKDVYPTRYRANTVHRLRSLFEGSGCRYVAGGLLEATPLYVPYPGAFKLAIRAGILERRLAKIPHLGGLMKPNLLIAFRRER